MCIYYTQIWPWLIGLYPTNATDEQTELIRRQADESYLQEMQEWRKVEVVHRRIMAAAEKARQERWKRECATHMSHTDVFKFGEERERGGEEVDGGENGVATNGDGGEVGEFLDVHTENGCEKEEGSAAVNGEREEEVAATADSVERSLCSKESSSTATPVPVQSHSDLHNGHTHTTPGTTPRVTPPSQILRSPSPEMSTLSDLSSITQSTASPFPSPQISHQPTHNHITSTNDDVITKERSISLDSGHSSGGNLGNSIGSGHGNGVMNGCHGDNGVRNDVDSTTVEWNGDSIGLAPSQGGESSCSKATISDIVDGATAMEGKEEGEGEGEEEGEGEGEGAGEGEGKGEGEGEMELDEKGKRFADELVKIDKDIPRCDRDYWYEKNCNC